MPILSKFANANAVVTTGWSSPANAYDTTAAIYGALTSPPASGGGEASQLFATAAPGKNASVTTDYGFPAFSTSDIPGNSSIINSVTIEARYKSSTTGSTGAVFGLQVNDNGSLLGETTFGMATSDQTVTKAATGIPLADLRTANLVKARVRGARTTSNTAITWSLDYVRVLVDYTLVSVADASLVLPLGLSAAGAVAIQGGFAGTLPLVLTAAGAVRVLANASLTLPLVLTAAGTVQSSGVTADAALTLSLALSSAAAVLVRAAASLPLAPVLAASATHPVTAAAALQLPLALQAAATHPVRADAGLTLTPALSAAAAVPVKADAAMALPLRLSATATVGTSATADASLTLPLALAAGATVLVRAGASLVLPLAPLATAVVRVKGDGVMTLPVTLGAAGAVLVRADLAELLSLALSADALTGGRPTGRLEAVSRASACAAWSGPGGSRPAYVSEARARSAPSGSSD